MGKLPSVEIPTRIILGVTVISARGVLTAARGSEALRSTVDQLLAEGVRRIVVDFQGVGQSDSSGVGLLMSLLVVAVRWGGILAFAGLPKQVLDVLKITQIASTWSDSSGDSPFLFFATVEEAVAAVLQRRPGLD